MNTDVYKQIHESMNARSTEDLQAIWQANDWAEWSDEAFGAIKDILQSRGADLPEQGEPIYKHEDEDEVDTDDFTDEELRIVNDENPPEFYDPFEVLRLGKWLRVAAVVSVVLAVLLALSQYTGYYNLALSYLSGASGGRYAAAGVAVVLLLLAAALQAAITYFPLRALAHILRILMQMEFNSRKGAPPAK